MDKTTQLQIALIAKEHLGRLIEGLQEPEVSTLAQDDFAAPAAIVPVFRWSTKSLNKMTGLHPDLVLWLNQAIQDTPVDLVVLEGVRSVERQRQLVAKGASKTMNSRHLTGHAVDVAPLVDGKVSWDWPLYHQIAPVLKESAKVIGVPIHRGS